MIVAQLHTKIVILDNSAGNCSKNVKFVSVDQDISMSERVIVV